MPSNATTASSVCSELHTPDTVPQASIDMNKVLEVADAEEVTGNAFSLAITAPDRVHFVKGTCREEYRSWSDVLSVFPRSKGRHKRNATFPGGQSTSIHQPSPTIRASTPQESRPRFNSCHSEPRPIHHTPPSSSWLQVEGDVYPTRDVSPVVTDTPPRVPASAPVDTRKDGSLPQRPHVALALYTPVHGIDLNDAVLDVNSELCTIFIAYHDQPASSASPPTRDKIQSEEKARTRRVQNREKRGVRSGRSFSEDFSGMLPGWQDSHRPPTDPQRDNDVARRILFDYEDESKRDEKLKDIADSITRPRFRRHQGIGYHRGLAGVVKPTRDSDCSEEDQKKNIQGTDQPDASGDKLVRGDPDGCGLDLSSQRYSPSSELRVDLPAEDLLNIKKGWLMKQGLNKEFNKHWFVLRGTALMYYRDPSAEDKGILDGVLDLSGVRSVSEVQVVRNYGFQATSWDERRYVLSAVTAGIRNNWMSAIRRAAGLQEPNVLDGSTISVGEKLERELDTTQVPVVCSEREPSIVPSTPLTPRSVLFSSDEEYRTASEGGRRESEDWGEPLTPLPPSPPLNRTPISRVKEKARSRVYKRSRSSPPSSRRSTLDSVRPDDLLLACCGEVPESDAEESTGMESVKSSLFDSADSQSTEIDELKRQLSNALCDVGNAEKELLKLRHHKNEMAALEKQVKDLLASLQHTEMQLEQRTLEVAELEQLKQNYKVLLQEHEELLARWREHTSGPEWRSLYQQIQERYHSDSEEWQRKLNTTEAALEQTSQVCERLGRELSAEQNVSLRLREEVTNLQQRLSHGIDENESLYQRVHDLENQVATAGSPSRSSSTSGGLSASRERGRSVDSLSDLTKIELDMSPSEMDRERLLEEYEELRGRFEKAVAEIRAMRRELRESHALYDDLELVCISLRQEASSNEGAHNSETSLMVSRIEDLTLKLSAAEKQVRTLKQKLTKSESRDKRRSLSLKGRESFQICKELEEKLGELEAKIIALETGKHVTQPKATKTPGSESPQKSQSEDASKGDTLKASSSRLRRKSLDSATSSEPMKVLIRLSSLEAKVKKATEKLVSEDGLIYKPESEPCQSVAVNVESPRETPSEENPPEESVYVRQLEDLVIKSRDKVQECLNLMSTALQDRSMNHTGALLDNFAVLEQRLCEVKDMLQECNTQCLPLDLEVTMEPQDENSVKNSVQCVVSRLESMLRTKLTFLLAKRDALRRSNKLDREAQLHLLAEKLAYETILVKRIAQSVLQSEDGTSKFKKWVMDNEILQSTRLISALKSKLSGHDQEEHHCESSVEYLTKVLVKKLLLQRKLALQNSGAVVKESSPPASPSNANSSIIKLLLKRQQELNDSVHNYKTAKLSELAASLANETLSYTNDEGCQANDRNEKASSSLEDRMIREAWEMAQEAVNRELIQAEISHITMRCGQLYEAQLTAEQEATFSFMAKHRSILEQWSDAVENILQQEMESSIEELTQKYEDCVDKWKHKGSLRQRKHSDSDAEESRRLLSEFSDVMAHKALIDARISLLLQEGPYNEFSSVVNEGSSADASNFLEIDPLLSDEGCNLEILACTEFEHLYQHFANECNSSIEALQSPKKSTKSQESIDTVMKSLLGLEESLCRLRQCMESEVSLGAGQKSTKSVNLENNVKKDSEITWNAICSKCSTLQDMVANLTQCVLDGQECQRCQQLQAAVQRLREQHEDQIQELKLSHEKAMNLLHSTLEQKQNELISKHQQENEELREKAQQLQMQLDSLDSEYNQQVANLRSLYEKTIASGSVDRFDDKNIQQRYQYEVEHLKALCEKGLIAMEKSHRRIIAEMEEKHQQELEQMRQEKDQALAEETQATLAALDAMRKAHEIEVQKEIAKFKAEFMKKVQYSKDFGALHKEHIEEIEGIKKEILSLSEKYSNKCVESATLEEQLAMAHQHIIQLDARNKKLKAQVENSNSSSRDQDSLHGDEPNTLAHLCKEARPGKEAALSQLWSQLLLMAAPQTLHNPGMVEEQHSTAPMILVVEPSLTAPQLACPREMSPAQFSRNPVLVPGPTTPAATAVTNSPRNRQLSPVQVTILK
ncbi:Uncharacterized protein GBIM_05111 [Gryllus bimaculatus]|nr:Uncharacterized protein GBIM_05111 [Gryllus bimaculatus]